MSDPELKKQRREYDIVAAFHEAAHAVAAWVLGIPVIEVHLGDDRTLRNAGVATQVEPTAAGFRDDLIVLWAGLAADRKRHKSGDAVAASYHRREGLSPYSSDRRRAAAVAGQLVLLDNGRIHTLDLKCEHLGIALTKDESVQATALSKASFYAARTLVEQYWPIIVQVAEELLQRRTLTAEELDALITTTRASADRSKRAQAEEGRQTPDARASDAGISARARLTDPRHPSRASAFCWRRAVRRDLRRMLPSRLPAPPALPG